MPIVDNWASITSFLNKSLTAVKKTINIDELWRVLVAASASGGTAWGFITAVQGTLNTIIIDPTTLKEVNSIFTMYTNKNYIGLAFFVAALIVDIIRRYNQGIDLSDSEHTIKALNELPMINPPATVKPEIRIV